jgi:uncharacterized protein (DUF2164 family)
MPLELSAPDRKQALASLARYCEQELDLEISEIQVAMLLDFFLKELAPSVHNSALADAQAFIQDRLAELESSLSEPAFAYWPKGSSVRRK